MATPLTLEQFRFVRDYLETDNWKSLLNCSLPIPILSPFFEPRHQFVRYDAIINRVVYEDRETFYGYGVPESPSDSRWMVPGTFQD